MKIVSMVKPITKFAARKSMWAGFFAFIVWSGVEAYDGASERFNARYSQAKDTVAPPLESTYEKVTDVATKLWMSIEANPGPSVLALAIFAFTVIYHKMSGKSLKDAALATFIHSTPPKPSIIQKAEQEVLFNQLTSTETVLEASIASLPQQIGNAKATAEALERDAERSRELADNKSRRAKKAQEEHICLIQKLEVAKSDLVAVREQLGRTAT